MSGEGGEGNPVPISSLEMGYTVGTEGSILPKHESILVVATKASESGVFDVSKTQENRGKELDGVINTVTRGQIDSYEALVDSGDIETFDILRRGLSLAINSDQKLQTSLNIGGLGEVLPEKTNYKNDRPDFNLKEAVMEVTITNPAIKEIYRKASEAREEYLGYNDNDNDKLAEKMIQYRGELYKIGGGLSGVQKGEWRQARTYLNLAIGVLSQEYTSADGSADAADVEAVLRRSEPEVFEPVSTGESPEPPQASPEVEEGTEEVERPTRSPRAERTRAAEEVRAERVRAEERAVASSRTKENITEAKRREREAFTEFKSRNMEEGLGKGSVMLDDGTDIEVDFDDPGWRNVRDVKELNVYLRSVIRLRANAAVAAEERLNAREVESTISYNDVEALVDHIESSGRESNDISLNSRAYFELYEVMRGQYFVAGLPEGLNLDGLAKTIEARLILNDAGLLLTKVNMIEDMWKALSAIHAGDIDRTLDKKMATTLFSRGPKAVLNLILPFNDAWNRRMDAQTKYFDTQDEDGKPLYPTKFLKKERRHPVLGYKMGEGVIVDLFNDVQFREEIHKRYKASPNFEELRKKMTKGKYRNLTENQVAEKLFMTRDLKIKFLSKDYKFGIYKDHYVNYRCDGDPIRKDLVKEWMVERLMVDQEGVSKKRAEKAEMLARRASLFYQMESLANKAQLDSDQLAQLYLIKFLKFQYGPGGRNRDAGPYFNIPYFERLAPTMLELNSTEESKKDRKLGSGVYAEDITPETISSKSDTLYLFLSDYIKRAMPWMQALREVGAYKDVFELVKLREINDAINKTMETAEKAGVSVLDLKRCKLKGEKANILNEKYRGLRQQLSRFHTARGWIGSMIESKFADWDSLQKWYDARTALTEKQFYIPSSEKKWWQSGFYSFISRKQFRNLNRKFSFKKVLQSRGRRQVRTGGR